MLIRAIINSFFSTFCMGNIELDKCLNCPIGSIVDSFDGDTDIPRYDGDDSGIDCYRLAHAIARGEIKDKE